MLLHDVTIHICFSYIISVFLLPSLLMSNRVDIFHFFAGIPALAPTFEMGRFKGYILGGTGEL